MGPWGMGTPRGALPGPVRVPAVCQGSSGRCGEPLPWAGDCRPFSLLTCSVHRFILWADAYCSPSRGLWPR